MSEYYGHKTMKDGSHIPLTKDEAETFFRVAEQQQAKRATDMPTDRDAIRSLCDAFQRLKELGWGEAMYCPKDGSEFDVIEPGSSGIHRCHYQGKWPDGHWWIADDGDLWPSHPILFRLDPEAVEAKRKRMAEAADRFASEREETT